MSFSRPIRDEDLYLLPLVKLITCVGRDLMFRVFTYGCPNKDNNNNLKDYLLQYVGITPSIFKKYFNKTQVEQMMTNPACDEFDVPLLFLAIKIACYHNIADKDSPHWYTQDHNKLEYLLKLLKDERNKLLHNLPMRTKAELNPKIDELRNLLFKIVELTSDRFGLDSSQRQQHLTELNHLVDQVRDQPLTEAEILQYKTLWLREYIENTLKDSGAAELKEMLKKLDHINPLSFMDGYDTLISLQSVFFQLLLEHQDQFNKKTQVEVNDMFKCSSVDLCSVIMVLGSAGAGKTILTKWLMLQWSKNNLQVPGLAEYDLVVPLECRSNNIDSLTKLIRSLIPNTCPKLGQDITTYIHNLKILFILDGVDEMNVVSRKVADEILHLGKTRQHTILCTSRPETAREFLLKVPDQYQKCIFNIVGIPPGEQEGFVRRYHDHLIQLGKSVQNTDSLVHFVNKSSHLQELYKCPLILLFVVYLWACQPDKLNDNTTDTEIYKLLYQMLEEKLRQRLVTQAASDNKNDVDIGQMLKELISFFSVETLLSLDQNEGEACCSSQKRLKFPFSHGAKQLQELASIFLSHTPVETSSMGSRRSYFPSDDCHNFFAARGILSAIRNFHLYTALRQSMTASTDNANLMDEYVQDIANNRIIRQVLNVVTRGTLEMTKYRNVLKHLVGLLSEQERVEDYEALELVELLKDSGIKTQDDWLKFLAEVYCVQPISMLIANSFFSDSNHLVIRSCDVVGMLSLLPHLSPDLLTLDLAGDLDDLPHLDHLLEVIAQKDCNVVVKHWRDLVDPDVTNITDHQLLRLCHQNARCRVREAVDLLTVTSDSTHEPPPSQQLYGTNWMPDIANKVKSDGSWRILRLEPLKSAASQSNLTAESDHSTDEQFPHVCEIGGLKKILVQARVEADDEPTSGKPTKCILLLGETGAGKTTFVSSVLNYLCNISFDDNYRFCVEEQRTEDHSITESQTDFITVYKIPYEEGMRHDCDLVIIDTPGLADTRGQEQQSWIMKMLEEFFLCDHSVDDLHCLGLVANATINRCSSSQKDIVDKVMSLFGKHVPNITNIIATHATDKPKVAQVMESAGVKFSKMFEFDNHVVFVTNIVGEGVRARDLKISELRWENMLDQYTEFFSDILEAEPVSVKLLCLKKHLDVTLTSLGDLAKQLSSVWTEKKNLEKELTNCNIQINKIKCPDIFSAFPGRHSHKCNICDLYCQFCMPGNELMQSLKNPDKFKLLWCSFVNTFLINFTGARVEGKASQQNEFNKDVCSFDTDPCSHCGHALSHHEVDLSESIKDAFNSMVLRKEQVENKIKEVSSETGTLKDQVVKHFLYAVVLAKTAHKLSPPPPLPTTTSPPTTTTASSRTTTPSPTITPPPTTTTSPPTTTPLTTTPSTTTTPPTTTPPTTTPPPPPPTTTSPPTTTPPPTTSSSSPTTPPTTFLDLCEGLRSGVCEAPEHNNNNNNNNHYTMDILRVLEATVHIFTECTEDQVISSYDVIMCLVETIPK